MRVTRLGAALAIAEHAIEMATDKTILIGPVAWIPAAGKRLWRFTIATADDKAGFGVDIVGDEDEDLIKAIHRDVELALVQRKTPVVVHVFADELEMARWCNAIWPCEKGSDLVAAIEAERA
jgi:hypothetical protein